MLQQAKRRRARVRRESVGTSDFAAPLRGMPVEAGASPQKATGCQCIQINKIKYIQNCIVQLFKYMKKLYFCLLLSGTFFFAFRINLSGAIAPTKRCRQAFESSALTRQGAVSAGVARLYPRIGSICRTAPQDGAGKHWARSAPHRSQFRGTQRRSRERPGQVLLWRAGAGFRASADAGDRAA